MKTKNRPSKAFTLVELMAVIFIIGVLIMLMFVGYRGVRIKAVAASLQSDLTNAADQLVIDQTRSSTGDFPATLAAADNNNGLKWSGNTTTSYRVNNSGTPKTFCLTASKDTFSYFITQEGKPMPGPCPVIYLDAGIQTSYSGAGSTWYDLSGNGNNAALSGVPGYDSANGGSIVFDSVNDYGIITNNASLNFSQAQSLLIIEKHTFTTDRRVIWNQAYGGYGTWTHEAGASINGYFGNAGANNTPYVSRNSGATPRGAWNLMCSVRDTSEYNWYLNGSLASAGSNPYGVLASTAADIQLGVGYTGYYWSGNIAVIMAYDRALSETEVKQVYETFRSRFGL